MARILRALFAIAEDLGLVSRTQVVDHNNLQAQLQGTWHHVHILLHINIK